MEACNAKLVSFGRLIPLLLLALCACAAPRPRPNIVLFLVDDLGWQDTSVPFTAVPTAQNGRWHTPNLERLAAQGMKFTNAYAAAPVCTPTRTAILSGLAPARTHITYWTLEKDKDTSAPHPTLQPPAWSVNGLQPDRPTLASLLGAAGYRTLHFGKAHFGALGTPGADPRQLGFEVNVAGHAAGAPGSYLGLQNFSVAGRTGQNPPKPSVWDVPDLEEAFGQDVFLEEVLARKALAEIHRAAEAHVPFYLSFAPYAVHVPIQANRRYLEHYTELDAVEAAYGTMIETVDAALGAILDQLERDRIAQDTLIVFASDNGGLSAHARGLAPDGTRANHHNAPLRSGKGSAYEGGVRVPLVVRWPGVVARNTVSDVPVISEDFFPTFLAAAGVPLPGHVDGEDLRPLFEHGALAHGERDLVWHQPHFWGVQGPGIEPFSALRRGNWRLVWFHTGRFELYDLEHDLGEQHDLARERPEIAEELARALDEALAGMGAQLSVDKATGQPVERPLAAWERFLSRP